jgi:hypothetical protein
MRDYYQVEVQRRRRTLAAAVGGAPYTVQNAEASTLIAAMSVAPNDTRKAAIDTLVGSLKSTSIWSTIDRLFVFAAHDAQAARLNWVSPGGTAAAEVSAPTFTTDRGYAGNGTSSYVNTQWVPNTGTNFTQNDACALIWARSAMSGTRHGVSDGSSQACIIRMDSSTAERSLMNTAAANGTNITIGGDTGLIGLERRSADGATTIYAYRNGVFQNSAAVASVARASQAVFLGGLDASGSLANPNTMQFSAFVSAASLGDTKQGQLYAALNTYMQAVGA